MPSPSLPHQGPTPDTDTDADTNLMAQMGFTLFGHQNKNKQKSKSTPHTAKRQKHTHPHSHASGANNTPLSTRPKPGTRAIPAAIPAAAASSQDQDHDQDPRYADSEAGSPADSPAGLDRQGEPMNQLTAHQAQGIPGVHAESGASRKRWPAAVQRLGNGDCAFFRESFVVEDPWAGMVGVQLL